MQSNQNPPEKSYVPKRYAILLAILLCYLVPIIALSTYRAYILPKGSDWAVFSIGLLIGCIGSVWLYWRMCALESNGEPQLSMAKTSETAVESAPPTTEHSQLEAIAEEWEKKYTQLQIEAQSHHENLRQLQHEKEQSHHLTNKLQQELETYQQTLQKQLQQKETQLQECQQTISEHCELIAKQAETIKELEGREQELNYEIKTLLRFASLDNEPTDEEESIQQNPTTKIVQAPPEEPRSSYVQGVAPFTNKVSAPETAAIQLHRCLDIATKMTHSQLFNNNQSRVRDVPVDNYALDVRRLCDTLREENNSVIILYSQRDHKLVFVNDQIKTLLGWTPEAFVPEFAEIIQPGLDEWKKGLNHLMTNSEARLRVLMRSKTGQTIPLNCHLGAIPSGLFRYHLVGILYPV